MSKPNINVTPLIDVLLVLLIIFMVVAPLKPSSFHARIPSEPIADDRPVLTHPDVLVVTVDKDLSLTLNGTRDLGTSNDAAPLIDRLKSVFAERTANGSVSGSFANSPDRPYSDTTERTVFIKAPRNIDYGSIARVVDAVKLAGAYPISLQIDRLD
ncbi:MAG: biopolymer transporter ExbD [Acidobacteria bacterium]|nr:biopolymer transporter ExbD [Acidobacteriota bacterium]